MRLNLASLFIFFTLSLFSQQAIRDSLVKNVYQSPTVKTQFEDSGESSYEKSTAITFSESLSKDFYKRQTIRQAGKYISKLQYKEAATLFESISSSDDSDYLVEKVGDMYYFDLDMKKSAAQYEKLYKEDANNMSANALYKYYLALKGAGKHHKAFKVFGAYKKKAEVEGKRRINSSSLRSNVRLKVKDILAQKPLFSVRNLDFNNKYSDFSPILLNKNQLMFSSSATKKGYHDFFVKTMDKDLTNVLESKKMPNHINSKYHETAATLSSDGKTMYFTRGNLVHGINTTANNLKLFKSINIDGEWSAPEQVSFSSDYYSVGHPALSPNGEKLYFASNMPGSLGASDIFVVNINDDGSYSKPKNLGPKINTTGDEQFPFVTETKLYFSSNGHVGLGGIDIFEIPLSDTFGFTELKNLGSPINSDEDDFSFIIDEDTQKGFFSSNRRGGKGGDDVYAFESIRTKE